MKLNGCLIFSLAMVVTHGVSAETLRYMGFDPSQLEAERPAIAAFEASHPGVTVQAQALPQKDFWPNVSAQAASGTLPDVLMMSSAYIDQWAASGNLADVLPFSTSLNLEGYTPSAVDVGRINGKLYAVPQSWSGAVLYYNKDAFDAAGLTYPTKDWTWEQFLAAAKKLTVDRNGDGNPEQWGYYISGRYAQVDGWVYRNGGRYLNAEGTEMTPNPEALHALKFLTDLVLKEKVAPKPKDLEGVRFQDVFPLGMAAMWVDGAWNISNNRTVIGSKFKWGIAEIPRGPDATDTTVRNYAWPDLLSVAANSTKKELAIEFIKHMTQGSRSAKDFKGGKVPAFEEVAQRPDWLERDQQPDNKEVILNLGQGKLYTGFAKRWDGWRGYGASGSGGMNGELDEVFNGRKSLEDAVTSFTSYTNDVLKR
ncbi:ABC transporter substrate-binding protein [Agrobacterium sp. CG160-95]